MKVPVMEVGALWQKLYEDNEEIDEDNHRLHGSNGCKHDEAGC